jgi:hypothetical protein
MKTERGNLWDHWARGATVVVTTNIGWDAERRNNMGAGMALQAWRRWPELAEWYGRYCRATAPDTPVVEDKLRRLIFLPVKPLIAESPAYSWDQTASVELIELGLARLSQHKGEIALSYPGCGNGGLDPEAVLPALEQHLGEDRFTLVEWFAEAKLPPTSEAVAFHLRTFGLGGCGKRADTLASGE